MSSFQDYARHRFQLFLIKHGISASIPYSYSSTFWRQQYAPSSCSCTGGRERWGANVEKLAAVTYFFLQRLLFHLQSVVSTITPLRVDQECKPDHQASSVNQVGKKVRPNYVCPFMITRKNLAFHMPSHSLHLPLNFAHLKANRFSVLGQTTAHDSFSSFQAVLAP